jgi:hypothetical protein
MVWRRPYFSGAACAVAFLRTLSAVAANESYSRAAERAWQWTMESPCRTMRWQGMYEDVGQYGPFENL